MPGCSKKPLLAVLLVALAASSTVCALHAKKSKAPDNSDGRHGWIPNRPGDVKNVKDLMSQSFFEELGQILPLRECEWKHAKEEFGKIVSHLYDSIKYEVRHGFFNSTEKSPQEIFANAYPVSWRWRRDR